MKLIAMRLWLPLISKCVPCFSGLNSEISSRKAFDNTSFRPEARLPSAKLLGETSLMFLCHPTLTKDEIKMTCDVMTTVVTRILRLTLT